MENEQEGCIIMDCPNCGMELVPVDESYARGRYMRQIYGCIECGFSKEKKANKIPNKTKRRY